MEHDLGSPVHGTRHYATLDTLRGVAALVVMAHHLSLAGITSTIFVHGHLAVDFFFELSGFVLAFTYRERLLHSFTFRRFVIDRVVRLYPLAIVGVLAGTLVFPLQETEVTRVGDHLKEFAMNTAFNAFLLPSPFIWTGGLTFPSNSAIWSLSFEIMINLVWAAGACRLTPGRLAAVCAFGLTWLMLQAASHGSADIGYSWATFSGGAARVVFGFMFGTLLQIRDVRPPLPSRSAALPIAYLLVVFFAPKFVLPNWFHDIVCISLVFPFIIIMSTSNPRRGVLSRFMGGISYPLYVIHLPLIAVAQHCLPQVAGWTSKLLLPSVTITASIVVSFLLYRLYDEPCRRHLRSALDRW